MAIDPLRSRRRRLLEDRFGLMLALVVVTYVLSGVSDSPLARVAFSLLFVAIVMLAAFAEGTSLRVRWAVSGVSAVLVVGAAAAALGDAGDATWALVNLLSAALRFAAIVLVLMRIGRHSTVSAQTVMGAVTAYTLIGFAMASVYDAVDLLTDEHLLGRAVDHGDYLYFSLVTLTTLGFGDLVPVTTLGKRLVTVEALVGQVFLVTLVARLVSLWGHPLRRDRPSS